MVHGMVLDLGKKKMSKSLGNIVAPKDIIEKYGRDYMRYYFAKSSKGEDFAFDEKEFREIGRTFMMLLNVNNFINQLENKKSKIKIEDKWILSKFNLMLQKVTESYDNYKFHDGMQALEEFLINDLSRNYIKLVRERSDEVYDVLNEIRIGLLKILAPVCPFVTEKIWQNLLERKIVKEESIHLSLLPKVNKKKIDEKLNEEMKIVFEIIENGLAGRNYIGKGLKWPLASVKIYLSKLDKKFENIIKQQLNVKKIGWSPTLKSSSTIIEFDTSTTLKLEAEGYAREMARNVQAFRKKLGLDKKDEIELIIFTDEDFKNILEMQKKFIQERTNSKSFEIKTEDVTTYKETFKKIIEFKIKDKRGTIVII